MLLWYSAEKFKVKKNILPVFFLKGLYVYQRPDIIIVLTFEDRENKIKPRHFYAGKILGKKSREMSMYIINKTQTSVVLFKNRRSTFCLIYDMFQLKTPVGFTHTFFRILRRKTYR